MNGRTVRVKPSGLRRRGVYPDENRRVCSGITAFEASAGPLVQRSWVGASLGFAPNLARFRDTPNDESFTGHARVVARYALLLAYTLGLTDEFFLRELERGAHLHDIGKTGIPRSILCKAGPLTVLEHEIIKEHPLIGAGMMRGLRVSPGIRRMILYHHERFDGRGYPLGLNGRSIPFAARIIALADALDAITSDRSYRARQAFSRARIEIIRGRGTRFDPYVVEAFESLSDENWRQVKNFEIYILKSRPVCQ